MIYEDKLIIENALNLWAACVLHKNELFDNFYNFRGDAGSKIQTCKDFILAGLLFCSYEKVREEFKASFSALSHKLLNSAKVSELPLLYLLRLLSENFALISNYQCKQYFELFCELIDHYFLSKGQAVASGSFNLESLLGLLIDKIKDYNKK